MVLPREISDCPKSRRDLKTTQEGASLKLFVFDTKWEDLQGCSGSREFAPALPTQGHHDTLKAII